MASDTPKKKRRVGGENAGGIPKVQDALGYLEKVKNKFGNQPAVYNKFLDIMKDFKSMSIDTEGVIKRVKDLFKGNRQLILGFNQFLPPGYKIELDPPPTMEFDHAVQYVAKIKARFKSQPEIYSEFLDILHDYQARRTIDEVYHRVQKLFGGQPDLLDEFKYFLPDQNMSAQQGRRLQPKPNKPRVTKPKPGLQARPGSANGVSSKRVKDEFDAGKAPKLPVKERKKEHITVTFPAGSEKELVLLEKIKLGVSRNQWTQLIKALNMFANDVVSRPELVRMVEDILGDKAADYLERFKAAIGYDDWEERQLQTQTRTNYYAFVSTVDFTTCKEVTPSYRELPGAVTVPTCSGRTPLCDEVLNDRYISIPTGSEDYSFKSTRKNVYEENLFKCEDERYELDMVIENNAAAIRALEPVVQQLSQMSGEQGKRLKLNNKDVDILHLKAIARLYGDQGSEVVDFLKRSPSVAAPVILQRLKQKDEEWRRVRVEMRPTWRKIYEQNYHRSLDHRSFYFKQEDKKRQSSKTLISELRDAHVKAFSPKDKEVFDSVLLRELEKESEPLYTYCMRYKYTDPSVHHQVYEVITRVANTILDESEQTKFHTFWLGFVHHFFGVTGAPVFPIVDAFVAGAENVLPVDDPEAEDKGDKDEAKEDDEDEGKKKSKADDIDMDSDADKDKKDDEEDKDEADEAADEVDDGAKDKTRRKKRGRGARRKRKPANPQRRPSTSKEPKTARTKDVSPFTSQGIKVKMEDDGDDRKEASGSRPASPTHIPSVMNVPDQGLPDGHRHVKPLKVSMDTWALEEKLAPMRRHNRTSKLFFANYPFYVWFRLHQFLYERLLTAKELSYKRRKRRSAPSNSKHNALTPEARYERFGAILFELLDNEMESGKFEDECRTLLGANSYVLFTIDKLTAQLVKQTQELLSSESSVKLLQLYQYEFSRARGGSWGSPLALDKGDEKSTDTLLERSAQLARMYYSNCAQIINDDSCCQLEFFEDATELGIGLLEGLPVSEPKPATSEWLDYVDKYLNSPPTVMDPAPQRPFLARNLRKAESQINAANESVGLGGYGAVGLSNGLEMKVCARSFKMHFVDDTSDMFLRPRHPRPHSEKGAAVIPPLSPEAKSSQKAKKFARQQDKVAKFGEWATTRLHRLTSTGHGTPMEVKP